MDFHAFIWWNLHRFFYIVDPLFTEFSYCKGERSLDTRNHNNIFFMALNVGQSAPNFTLTDSSGEGRTLQELRGEGKLLLLFFPLAFSSVCTDEMCSTRDNMKFYEELNVRVAGISVDSFFTLKVFKEQNNINFPLLSDFNKEVSEAYGALYDTFFDMKGVSKRSAFLIDENGTVAYAEVLENAGDLPDFKAIHELLD